MQRAASALLPAVILLCAVFVGQPAAAQRIQFPSAVPGAAATQPPSPSYASPPVAGSYQYSAAPPLTNLPYASQPSAVTPIAPSWDPYATSAAGSVPPPASAPYTTPQPALDPAYGSPAYGSPAYGSPYYATPATPQAPGALFPDGAPFGWQQGTYTYQGPDGTVTQLQRFLQNVGMEYTWLPALQDNAKKFEINKVELWSTFGIPFLYNTETPLRVTPGFAVNYLEGPVSRAPLTVPPTSADLPPRLYDAYLDGAWEPRVTEWLSGDLGLRVGVYSDFSRVNTDSVRFMGRGVGVLQFTPSIAVAAGVWYIDRNHIKLLPAGGVIWTPSPDTNFRIVFPNPKLAHRFTTVGTAEWWWYFTGEYGGGAWTVERYGGVPDRIDYNDIRVAFGLEWIGQRGVRGHIELGYVWDREILFVETNAPPSFKPDDTIMLRGGLDY